MKKQKNKDKASLQKPDLGSGVEDINTPTTPVLRWYFLIK